VRLRKQLAGAGLTPPAACPPVLAALLDACLAVEPARRPPASKIVAELRGGLRRTCLRWARLPAASPVVATALHLAARARLADGPPALSGPFVPSAGFVGARAGYVFKMGGEGLGYYQDAPASAQPAVAPWWPLPHPEDAGCSF
jgi:hypothetical protein